MRRQSVKAVPAVLDFNAASAVRGDGLQRAEHGCAVPAALIVFSALYGQAALDWCPSGHGGRARRRPSFPEGTVKHGVWLDV